MEGTSGGKRRGRASPGDQTKYNWYTFGYNKVKPIQHTDKVTWRTHSPTCHLPLPQVPTLGIRSQAAHCPASPWTRRDTYGDRSGSHWANLKTHQNHDSAPGRIIIHSHNVTGSHWFSKCRAWTNRGSRSGLYLDNFFFNIYFICLTVAKTNLYVYHYWMRKAFLWI